MLLRTVGSLAAILVGLGIACSPASKGMAERAAREIAPEDAGTEKVRRAERVEIVRGVPDRGRDPSVVAIDVAGEGLCSGTLISPRLVLTARHCVSRTAPVVECPPQGPQVFETRPATDFEILTGDDLVSVRRVARGLAVVSPGGLTLCDADIAILLLDVPVTSVKPLPLRSRGPAVGDRVRTVGYGATSDDGVAGRKMLREHVPVLEVGGAEFTVGEATCQGDSGGPAIDEDTGEVIGILSRGGPSCEGADVYNVYTRVDAYSWLVEEAFVQIEGLDAAEKADAGKAAAPRPAKRGTNDKPEPDVGGMCVVPDDCAAGVCITDTMSTAGGPRMYCTRPCGMGDRCPTRFHCLDVEGLPGGKACVNVR